MSAASNPQLLEKEKNTTFQLLGILYGDTQFQVLLCVKNLFAYFLIKLFCFQHGFFSNDG